MPNDNVRKAYKSAISLQKDVIEKTKAEGGNVDAQRNLLSELMIELAKYSTKNEKNNELAL